MLVFANPFNYSASIAVHWGDRAFAYSVPAQSAATFTWAGSQENPAAPAQPTNMTKKVNSGKIDLKWDFSPLADTYTVKRSEQAGGPYTLPKPGQRPEHPPASAGNLASRPSLETVSRLSTRLESISYAQASLHVSAGERPSVSVKSGG